MSMLCRWDGSESCPLAGLWNLCLFGYVNETVTLVAYRPASCIGFSWKPAGVYHLSRNRPELHVTYCMDR